MTSDPRPGRRTSTGPATLWTITAGLTACWGLIAVARLLPWQAAVAVFLSSSLLGASMALSADAVASDRVDLWKAARTGLLSGLVVLVLVGLANGAGLVGPGLLAAVLLTRPGLRARLREAARRRRERAVSEETDGRPGRGAAHTGSVGPDERDDAWDRTVPGSLATESSSVAGMPFADAPLDSAPDWSPTLTVPTHLSDHDLCLAWESSSRALRRCATTEARLDVVRVRQACLDELERRQPEAVRAWVLAGADPDASPARYLAS